MRLLLRWVARRYLTRLYRRSPSGWSGHRPTPPEEYVVPSDSYPLS